MLNDLPLTLKKILIPRFDTMGDIVLLQGFIEAIKDEMKEAEITLLVRERYIQLRHLFPKNIEWIGCSLNPYRAATEEDILILSSLLEEMGKIRWDLLLITTYNRTWIDDLLANKLRDVYSIAIGDKKEVNTISSALLKKLKLDRTVPYNHFVPVEEDGHETEKYETLWKELFNMEKTLSLPELNVENSMEKEADEILGKAGIHSSNYFVCVPAGKQNNSLKLWSEEKFVTTLSRIYDGYRLQILLAGHEDESDIIESVGDKLKNYGYTVATWLGRDGEVPILTALLKRALFYLGNDTGPLHIAMAVQIPVIAIYGGGHWPRFLPAGKQSISITTKLPCFKCDWDCLFYKPLCLEMVTVDDVMIAVEGIINKNYTQNVMYSTNSLSEEHHSLIKQFSKKYKGLKSHMLTTIDSYEIKLWENG